jgi:hypothetical protein
MATPPVPEEHRFFIARADWREEGQYRPADSLDASMWAWELLRRNNQYAQDYAEWHERIQKVPPVPPPKISLDGYFCVPKPAPGIVYEEYKAEHPNNLVLPIEDHIRERWGITRLMDPELSALDIAAQAPTTNERTPLAWLFTCNTPDILNPPTHWPEKNYISHRSTSMLVPGFCTGTEVMVRLDFTGNFEAQIESLRRQIGAFFEGGTRSGSRVVERQPISHVDSTEQPRSSLFQDMEALQGFLAVRPNWNTTPAKLKSLRNVTRMADVVASLEAGKFDDQLREKRGNFDTVDISDLDLSIDPDFAPIPTLYVAEHERVKNALTSALLRYFKWHPLGHEELNSRLIDKLLDLAYQLVCGDHVLVARMTAQRPSKE